MEDLSKSAMVGVLAILVSGVVINWISNLYQPAGPILLVASLVALVLLFLAQTRGATGDAGSSRRAGYDLLGFALIALLLGAGIGALWLLPVWSTAVYRGLWGMLPFYNYEFGSATTIAALGAIAVWRRAKLDQAMVFVASAVTGMTLAISIFRPENEVLPTIVGWAAYGILVVLVAAVLPDALRVLTTFFGFRRDPIAEVDALREADGDPRAPSAGGEGAEPAPTPATKAPSEGAP